MNLEEKLYTSTEVAQILGVSLRSVYRYMEEGKLDAEVKTATGRHRFTRQNILDFLYPKGEQHPEQTFQQPTQVKEKPIEKRELPKKEEPISYPKFEEEKKQPQPVQPVEESKVEEPVDWLAKFREAANKFKSTEVIPEPEAPKTVSSTESLTEMSYTTTEYVSDSSVKFFYYRSMIGGLKDIAQGLDKNARRSFLDYAFTLNSGLSLHKPIKPFSLLHVYIREEDREFFERNLSLVVANEKDAQLCIMTSSDKSILNNKKEMHGLFVVSDLQLKKDLLEAGEITLASELDSILTGNN